MGINDGNKTDQFDNEQAQLVHNDVAYQGATETTVNDIKLNQTNGTQKTQITDGAENVEAADQTPSRRAVGLVVRTIPYEPPTFTVTAKSITLGNQKSLFAIQNTSTSIVKIKKIYLTNSRTTAVTGVAANLTLQRIASFTGGTSLISYPHNTLNTLPSGITMASGATFSSESALFRDSFWSSDEWGPGTADVEAGDHSNQELIPWYEADSDTSPITLIQNQGAHVKCDTNTTAGAFTITVVFTVEQA